MPDAGLTTLYSHEGRLAATRPSVDVRAAAQMLLNLAARVAREDWRSTDNVPQCVRRQRWSALSVPLMWAAAGASDSHPILEWLAHVTGNAAEVDAADGSARSVSDLIPSGWNALRLRFRAWGLHTQQDLARWMVQHGYASVSPGDHFSWQCQEFILNSAAEQDATVVNLEIGYAAAALHLASSEQMTFELREGLSRRRSSATAATETALQPAPMSEPPVASPAPMAGASSHAAGGAQPPASSWRGMAALDLEAEIRKPARTVREPPRWFRGSLRQALLLSLRAREQRGEAAWKLFLLTPRMLLGPTDEGGDAGKAIFFERLRRFQRGEWVELLEEAAANGRSKRGIARELDEAEALRLRREEAERRVVLREVSRARVLLTSSGLAPGNQETLEQLTDTDLRPDELTAPLPQEALRHQPRQQLQLEGDSLARALRSAGRGSAPDLAGMRYEHLRVLIEDEDAWNLFTGLAQDFARAAVPDSVLQALRLGRMTALKKDNGKVRGIVAGSILRRLVCKTVASQFSDSFLERTAPFQFALQTKAGTDALAHAVRVLTDLDPDTVVVSLDGVGAFDHVKRAAFFDKLLSCEELRPLLPLVSALYGTKSRFLWFDAKGEEHVIEQGEGGEQGCPLMPALYALAQHEALVEADSNLLPDERLFSFLDDLYLVTSRARAAEAFEDVAGSVKRHAGVQSHLGKLRAWCRGGGPAPPELQDISAEAWTADLPEEQNGLVILGTPLGKSAFVEAHARRRLEIEERLLRELPGMKDPQKAWVLLSQSAVPRANHTLRTLPPTVSVAYAQAHDDALWLAFNRIFGAEEHRHDVRARALATLPGRLGGMGLRSALRTAEAAFWAAWVDALPVIASKVPDLAERIVTELQRPSGPRAACLQEAAQARERLLALGADQLPSWPAALAGAEPPQPETADDFEFARGWQWYACSVRETFFAERVLLPSSSDSQRAMVLSQGGSGGAWLRAIPSERIFQMSPLRFQVAIRRRLHWPLPLTSHTCRGQACKKLQDEFGHHPASCNRSGLLKARSRPIEKVWARVLREGGARVRENVTLRDAGIPVGASDGRQIEVVVTGLPIEHGIPVAVDATMVSPLHADGTPHAGAAARPGVALERGRKDKERTYPELLTSSRLRLLTAAVETGGRMSKDALRLLSELSTFKASSEPPALRASAARAWRARWLTMISTVCQDSLAATLVDDGVSLLDVAACSAPLSVDVWVDDARC